MATVSAAATTLIAAFVALLSAVIGGLLVGRQQRSSQARERMLDIALDYVQALRDTAGDAPVAPRPATDAAKAAKERAFRLSQAAILVFGPDSRAGEAALAAYFETRAEFDHAQQPLDIDTRIEGDESEASAVWLSEHEEIESKAAWALDAFSREAGRAIRSGGRPPWFERAIRMPRRLRERWRHRDVARALKEAQERYLESAQELRASRREYREALDRASADQDATEDQT
jgi:hypothetical protein